MDRKKFYTRTAMLLFLIFILNSLAEKYHLYYSVWYFDMMMHFLGGLWLGLFAIWFLATSDFSIKSVLNIAIGVLLIGISWEIFEFIFLNMYAKISFDLMDTVSDIFFDLSGGFTAIVYFFTRIVRTNKNTV